MSNNHYQLTVNFWVALITLLMTGNGYFIKRLVDKLDTTETQVYALREDVATIKARLNDIIEARVLDIPRRGRVNYKANQGYRPRLRY